MVANADAYRRGGQKKGGGRKSGEECAFLNEPFQRDNLMHETGQSDRN